MAISAKRGPGKTFSGLSFLINRYLKYGEKSIYLRRWSTELDAQSIIQDMQIIAFPEYEFTVKGGGKNVKTLCIKRPGRDKEEPFMKFYALSQTYSRKSVPEPEVKWIFFEEFIIPRGMSSRYISKDEANIFKNFYDTIDRRQGRVRVLMAANAIDIANPYFLYWNIMPKRDVKWSKYKDGLITLEMVENKEYNEWSKQSDFEKLFDDGDAVAFANDNDVFIGQKSSKAIHSYTFQYDQMQLAVWMDAGTYYITRKHPKGGQLISIMKKDHTIDSWMVEKTHTLLKAIKRIYSHGYVRFSDSQVKQQFYYMLDYLGLR
jgi:hypothetical protein